jgi:hypothetical protein
MIHPTDDESGAHGRLEGLPVPIPTPPTVGKRLVACPVCHRRFKNLVRYELHYRMTHTVEWSNR